MERTSRRRGSRPPDPGWPGSRRRRRSPRPPAPSTPATADGVAGGPRRSGCGRSSTPRAAWRRPATAAPVRCPAAFANTAGQSRRGQRAEAAMAGIARTGGADGVARLAAGRLADLDGAALGARAAAKARAGADPVELPPGRYEVVLEPTAVADLLQQPGGVGFNGKAVNERPVVRRAGRGPVRPGGDHRGRPGRPRRRAAPGLPFDVEGTPRRRLTLVRDGTTAAVTHDRRTRPRGRHHLDRSRVAGVPDVGPDGHAPAARGAGAPGRPRRPIPARSRPRPRPLVAAVRRGLLVTDFWYTRVLDPRSLVITGPDPQRRVADRGRRGHRPGAQLALHPVVPAGARARARSAASARPRWRCRTVARRPLHAPALHLASGT